jgi:coronatine-insensitive protein 1
LTDETLACVLKHVEGAQDRAAVSRVCQQWRRVDGATRKFVTIAYMYSTSPEALTRRFSRLKGVKIKGKPRAAEYDLLVPCWGGYAQPWIRELGRAYSGLLTLQLRRCQVSDADLALAASSPFHAALQVLHLHKCAGFSTAGLLPVARSCR